MIVAPFSRLVIGKQMKLALSWHPVSILVAATLSFSLLTFSLTADAQTKIKVVLAWKWSGPMAWYLVADDRGYFKAEGLSVVIDQGDGSAASIPKVASGAYDAGAGDINTLIDLAGRRPADAPVAVYMTNNVSPFTIAVKRASTIKTPKDLEGRLLGAPVNDAALKLFPAFAKATGIDSAKVKFTNMAPNLREQMLARDQIEGALGYYSSINFSAKLVGLDPNEDIRYLKYSDYGLDLYQNVLFFSKPFIKDHPEAIKGFLRALNRALKEVVANPGMGIDHVMKREPLLNRKVETERLMYALKHDMNHPEIATFGYGDVDEARLKNEISIIVDVNRLPRTPTVSEIFDRRFLPARGDRLSGIATRLVGTARGSNRPKDEASGPTRCANFGDPLRSQQRTRDPQLRGRRRRLARPWCFECLARPMCSQVLRGQAGLAWEGATAKSKLLTP